MEKINTLNEEMINDTTGSEHKSVSEIEQIASGDSTLENNGTVSASNVIGFSRNGIKEQLDGYYKEDPQQNGKKRSTQLTNFIFTNVRKVRNLGKEESLLVDIKEGSNIRYNVLIAASLTCERRKLLPYLRAQNTNLQIYTHKTEELDAIIEYVSGQTQAVESMVDYTGLFQDKQSGMYYYVALNRDNEITYIVPNNVAAINHIYIAGPRHLSTQTRINQMPNNTSWKEAGKEMLDIVPKTLKDSKSLMILAWHFSSLINEWIHNVLEHRLPILFVYGEKGSGKSTNLDLVSMYFGKHGKTLAMGSTPQPIREAMAATNAFPILTTETDDRARNIQTTVSMLKELFDKGKILRGHLSGNESFHLQAPWIMQGNNQISNEAVQDRMLQILVQKSDQNDCNGLLREALLNKSGKDTFIAGYLQYLIDNQNKWNEWYGQAKVYLGTPDTRQLNIQISMLIGLMMIQDLRQHLDMPLYTESEIKNFAQAMQACQSDNQVQPQHIKFLEFLQEYCIAPEFVAKKMYQEQDGIHKFHKKRWEDAFKEYMAKDHYDINMGVILKSLEELGKQNECIRVGGSSRIFGTTCKNIILDPVKLEEATGGEIRAENWNSESKK
ncbi:hypothetical protein [Paenibacillus campi]|uniref:hypothetical protein n=1 Tax=Paenibacillus campi TaxID=3106031 RepID=UPI002AFE0F9E|nr:hypothetical protein [Paenibacillus sp. SGZ-1009]